jgi:adenylate kinase family enzyme
MKIHIIGASGAGKTYLAHRLAERYGIPAYALDDLFWDNAAGRFNVKRHPAQRDELLNRIVRQEDWILEGVQYAWLEERFRRSDVTYLLETPPLLCRVRIVRRFLWRVRKGKQESLKSLIDLLKWTRTFYRVNLPEIETLLGQYSEKVVRIDYQKGRSARRGQATVFGFTEFR